MGLAALRIFGSFPKVVMLLMFFFAILSFGYAIGQSRQELKEDNSQVIRFVIIGCTFILVGLLILLFSFGFPLVYL